MPAIAPAPGYILWFKADAGITKIGTGVTDWADQGPNHWDVHCVNAGTGAPELAIERPVFTDNVINGLPGLRYVDPGAGQAHGILNYRPNDPTVDPIPTVLDAPKTILALVMRDGTYGGFVFCTCRGDLEFGMWDEPVGPGYRWTVGDPTNAVIMSTAVSYVNVPIVMEWRFYGSTASPQTRTFINGSEVSTAPRFGALLSAEVQPTGFSIGCVPTFGASRGWQGYITEVVMYGGTDEATSETTREYLMRRAGLLGNARPPLQAATGPSAGIGAAATGHLFRYAPKAFGDRFSNP